MQLAALKLVLHVSQLILFLLKNFSAYCVHVSDIAIFRLRQSYRYWIIISE
jgi:hypothetical protein